MLINLAMQTPIDTCTYKNVNECGDGIIFNEIGNFVFSYLCERHNDVIKCSKINIFMIKCFMMICVLKEYSQSQTKTL